MTTATKPTVHHGNNLLVKRLSRREKQDAVAKGVFGESGQQSKVQRLEQQETIDDTTLTLFAQYFGCTLEELRDTEIVLEAVPVNIYENTFNEGSNSNLGHNHVHDNVYNYNSKELILELCAEKDKQIEQLLASLNTILELDKKQREEMAKLLGKK